MKLVQLMGALFSSPPARLAPLDIAPPPADVAPLPTLILGSALGVLVVLGLGVGLIVLVAFFVIRAIRKNRAASDNPPAEKNP